MHFHTAQTLDGEPGHDAGVKVVRGGSQLFKSFSDHIPHGLQEAWILRGCGQHAGGDFLHLSAAAHLEKRGRT